MTKPPKSILIVLHGAIGDVARALPLAVRIKRFLPGTHLAWAIEPRALDLVRNHPAVDQVIVFERGKGLLEFVRFLRSVRARKFDLVLDLQRHFKSGVVSAFSGAKSRIGFHPKNAREFNWLFNNQHIPQVEHRSHKLLHFQLFGDELQLPSMDPLEFGLTPSVDEQEEIDRLLRENGWIAGRPLVAFLLGSTWESRIWPAKNYSQLASMLATEDSAQVVLVGGLGDIAIAGEVRNGLEVGAVDLVGKTSLRQLVALFYRCALAVGSDSGPMHIAAACGLRVISLWGATSAKRSAPFGSTDLVLEAAIGCSPCYRRRCPGLGTACMRGIGAGDVLALARGHLSTAS